MPILFFEGFETVSDAIGESNRAISEPLAALKWTQFFGNVGGQAARGYLIEDFDTTGYAWRTADSLTSAFHARYLFPQNIVDAIAAQPEVQAGYDHIIGFRLHVRSTPSTSRIFGSAPRTTTFNPSFNSGIIIEVVDSTDIVIKRATTTLATAVDVLIPGQWHYIEMRWRTGDSTGLINDTGFVIVNVDGVEVINETLLDTDPDFTGVNARDYVGFEFLASGGSGTDVSDWWGFDDIYSLFPYDLDLTDPLLAVVEGPASAPYDNFLGPVRVRRFELTADVGPNDWDSSGVDDPHYEQVDELGANDVDYLQSEESGQEELFSFAPFSGAGTVYGIKVEAEAINTTGGDPTLKIKTDTSETQHVIDNTAGYQCFAHYDDNVAGFNDKVAGMEFDSGMA